MDRQARSGGDSNYRWEGILIIADQNLEPFKNVPSSPNFSHDPRLVIYTVRGASC
jgi:hypothetical protein